jgi:hypothetical protein
MTRDDILRMAREAGFSEVAIRTPQDLERFAALVAAAEREECARLLEDFERFGDTRDCVAAILERGKQ